MQIKYVKMRWATGGVNYSYLLSKLAPPSMTSANWIIDPAEPLEVKDQLSTHELQSITTIVNTHHHYDHAGGNIAFAALLTQRKNPSFIIGSTLSATLPTSKVTQPNDEQIFDLGHNITVEAIRTPCHTQDSVCYLVKDSEKDDYAIFTGDTLFTAGCGRFFEGTGEEMHNSLNHILERTNGHWDKVKVYPGHEYTKSNVKFIRHMVWKEIGDNKAFDHLEQLALNTEVLTGMFTLQDELDFNPFMRLNDPFVRKAVGDDNNTLSEKDVMTKLRKLKDNF
ncbi:hypothetical protein ACO0SA_004557 [Hanseniaspora valbyensis]